MPARHQIDDFKRLIDMMAFIKMNTVILEVGGGMEYEKHPEINEAWVKFCKTIKAFPGLNGYKSFQGSDFYWKDSIHTELCDGSYLTKREVRDLVDYCKSRGMDVIPEVQGLSHCYYLTMAHPEIAELRDDPFPDTYCPNNEKSYELYFDVAEEVIEVFEPTTVSIGHDEIRVLGWCDKCKDKSGEELVGGDINKASARTPFAAMKQGDKAGKEVVDKYINYLACGITNIINIFQPNVLCIGGGVANEGSYLLDPIIEIAEKDQFTSGCELKTKICIAELGNDAGIIGAAAITR
jgi:hypothetical protein